ncbi:MAG: GAF domain-containing protein, partial [Chloroflexales bacterium]|nr:GAF domain-containing protein [Chloroflexales bacterium]
SLVSDAEELARQLDALVRDEISRVTNLSLSRAAQEFVAARPDQRSALFTPTLADFDNFIASNDPFYQAVLLFNSDGEVLLSTEGSYVGQNFTNSAFFQQARQGESFMSNPGISTLSRQPVIWLSAPVYTQTGQPDAPHGVVAVALSPEELWQAVEQLSIGQRGYAMLVDQYGIRLAHGRDRRYIFRSLTTLPNDIWSSLQADGRFGPLPQIEATDSVALMDYLNSDPLPSLLIGQPGPQSEQVYYSAARMQTRDWTVIAMLPEAEILAPAGRVTFRGLGATLILTALLGLSVTWVAKQLVRPVSQLTAAATQIAHGDLSSRVDIRGSSELRDLAANFETMRQHLRSSRDELAAWAQTLEQRVVWRTQELAALSEVIAFASRTQSRDELAQTALQQALAVMGAELGGIWIADASGALHLVAQQGFNPELQEQLTLFAPGEGLLGQVQEQGQALALDNISLAPRLARAVVKQQGLHSFAAVPLRIYGRNLGVMGIFSYSQAGFTPEAVALAASIAQQIALTFDNIALVEQVQEQARDVASLQERERIAGEIHDSIAQTLGYLYLQTDRLANDIATTPLHQTQQHLFHMQEILATASTDVRQYITNLRAADPPPIRLSQSLGKEIERLTRELNLRVELAFEQADDMIVSAYASTELVRIVGEALRNAERHGRADMARIDFRRKNGFSYLSISDNGTGFDPERPPDDGRSHFGLSVMRARAARIGGELHIASQPGAGAHVQIRWPNTTAVAA